MLQAMIVGYLGADAETKNENGKEFTTFRVAHSDRWTDAAGKVRETTVWVDVILSGRPNVAYYLKAGTLVCCVGHCKLRCYSSEKARAFVAGMTISAVLVELLGGKGDEVPHRLYDIQGNMYEVAKYFYCKAVGQVLNNGRGKEFAVDDNGWVMPLEQAQQMAQQQADEAQAEHQPEASEAESKTKTKKGK